MDEIEALLPGVCRFLEEDLCHEELSSPCRYSLKQLLDRVEVLRLGQSPPRPGVSLRPPKQGRKARSLPINKRFSLPTNVLTPFKSTLDDTYEEPNSLLQPGQELKEADEESSGTEFENEEEEENMGQDIILPKKAPARRLSSSHFLDQPWTMVGPLSHRYKQQKWQRLAFCVLAGMRLTAFKSTHSDKPTLAIFLSGYTAIYAERDSGMAHVVKLTHPHQETHVVAADTEEQALSWAEQINLYSRGITPTDVTSFMEHSVVHDGQEDSGFSAPVSSGSEGGSGDGVVGNTAAAAHQRRFSCPLGSPAHLISSPPCTAANAASGITTVTSAGANSCRPMHSVDGLLQSRSSGLISSMRRKVESLNAKRKSRKSLVSLPVHFTPAEDAILTGVASVRMVNAQSGVPPGNWVERWCQLRPGLLETFRLDTTNVEFSINLDGVSLGLSNDKKHRAALRLTSSDPAVDLLLFEVADKIHMGSWIRGFIQALGIIPTVPYEAIVDWLPCPGTETNAEEPIYDEVASPNCLNRSSSGGDSSARGTPNSAVNQSPSPSVGGQPNRLVPLPPLPIRSDTCLGYSAGGCSDPSNDYYGSSRNSVQTVVEATRSVDGDLSAVGGSTDRHQMEERRRRLAEVMSRCEEQKSKCDPLYFEYECDPRGKAVRGHRRVNSDPIHDPLVGKVPAKVPALAAVQRPTHLETRRGAEAMEVDGEAPAAVELSDIKALGAPPPPPQTPLAATPMTQTSTSFSAASTPTSSSSGSGSGGVALRPRSLLRKTSVEMAQEEMEALREDIAVLRRKKSDLRRRPGSDDELRFIEEEIRLKDERLRSLQNGGPSRRRFSLMLSPAATNENKTFLDGLPSSAE